MDKHAKTQHVYVIWLLMKKYWHQVKEHTLESRGTVDFLKIILLFVPWFCLEKVINLLSEVWSFILWRHFFISSHTL